MVFVRFFWWGDKFGGKPLEAMGPRNMLLLSFLQCRQMINSAKVRHQYISLTTTPWLHPYSKLLCSWYNSKQLCNCKYLTLKLSLLIYLLLGTTVFCGTWNFEPSHGICPFPQNFYVFTEFCGFRSWPVIRQQAPPIRLRLMALYKFALYCIVIRHILFNFRWCR